MGKILRKELIGYRCELHTCPAEHQLPVPLKALASLTEQARHLGSLVDAGWGLVLNPHIRVYCPTHASRVWDCSCRLHPERPQLCTAHDPDAAARVWDGTSTPTAYPGLAPVPANNTIEGAAA